MSTKEIFELFAMFINIAIGSAGLFVAIGLIVIIAFPEAIQPRGFYRNKIRTALQPFLRWVWVQLKFFVEILMILTDRQKLKDTLHEIDTGQKSFSLR